MSTINTKINSQLGKNIMRRVYIVTYLRRILSPFAVKFYIASMCLWGIGQKVFVASVFHNAPGRIDLFGNINFFGSAFTSTKIIVQVLIVATLLALVWLAYDLIYRRERALIASF